MTRSTMRRGLARLLRGIRSKVNLIPFNPFPDAGFAVLAGSRDHCASRNIADGTDSMRPCAAAAAATSKRRAASWHWRRVPRAPSARRASPRPFMSPATIAPLASRAGLRCRRQSARRRRTAASASGCRRLPRRSAATAGALDRTHSKSWSGWRTSFATARSTCWRSAAATGASFGALSAMVRAYGEQPLPRFLPLRAGSMNTIARSVGCRQAARKRMLAAAVARLSWRRGTVELTERQLIESTAGITDSWSVRARS